MGLQALVTWAVTPLVKAEKWPIRIRPAQILLHFRSPARPRTVGYKPLMAASLVSRLTKAYPNQEQIPQQVVLDLATYALMPP